MAYNPPIGSIYHLYTSCILPSGGLCATYHLLGELETTIDLLGFLGQALVNFGSFSRDKEVKGTCTPFTRMCGCTHGIYWGTPRDS